MMAEPELDPETEETGPAGPYQAAAADYHRNGWHPLPVVGKAGHLPAGYTGHNGVNPTFGEVVLWADDPRRGADNVALRLDGVIGIDVDAYEKDGHLKRGDVTFRLAIEQWGPLPPTWRSTSRDYDNPSGIYFFRVPAGNIHRVDLLELPDEHGEKCGDVEIIQFHHRYAVVWPSIHPDTQRQYRWWTPDGEPSAAPPSVDELPELPQAWFDALDAPPPQQPDRDPVAWEPQRAPIEQWHHKVADQHEFGLGLIRGAGGTRHDNMLRVVGFLARLESNGETGATSAIEALQAPYDAAVGPSRAGEYEKMVRYARDGVAVTTSTYTAPTELGSAEGNGHTGDTEETPETEAPNRHHLALLDETALGALPPPEPLADGWFYRRSLAVLYGPPKKGKTFVAIDLAMSVATGTDWLGGTTTQGNVVYCLGEGVAGMHRRLIAWRQHRGITCPTQLAILPHTPQLANPVDVTDFIDAVRPLAPDLIVIDTLARASVGLEENSAKEMGEAIAQADRIKEATGACILLVHHTGKDSTRGTRGSSALTGAIDTGVEVRGDPLAMTLVNSEQKDAEPSEPRQFRSESVAQSMVFVRTMDLTQATTATLSVMEALVEIDTGGVPSGTWKRLCEERGIPERSYYRSVKWLQENGQIRNLGSATRAVWTVVAQAVDNGEDGN